MIELESNKKENTDEESNNFGSFDDLNPRFFTQVRALFKKQILIKIRHVASIIEIIIALLLCLVMYPVYLLAKDDFPSIVDPRIDSTGFYFSESLFAFFSMFNDSKIVVMPNNDKMKELVNNMPRLNFMISGTELPQYNISLPKREILYFDSYDDMEDKIYESDANGIAISWDNWKDDDCYENPVFEVYCQYSGFTSNDIHIYLELEVFLELKQSAAKLAYEKKSLPFSNSILNSSYSIISDNPYFPTVLPPKMNVTVEEYKRPKITKRYQQAGLILAILVSLPFILASMPDMEAILNEKDTHVSTLMFIMGMSEGAYWFVNFMTPFIICFFCYLISSIVYTCWFGLKGGDCSLVLVTSILFVISQLWCIYFLSVFIQKASNGRILTVVMIVFVVFISYLHAFLTLDEGVSSTALRNIICIIPFSAFELFMMQAYAGCIEKTIMLKWNDLNNKGYVCPLWIPLMWLGIDTFIYFFLFVILNAIYKRPFGTPIIKMKELFTKSAWKRIFQTHKSKRIGAQTQELMEVSNLKKIYKETHEVVAIKDASFEIKSGEVIVMIGPNGSGKSTLINLISGAIEPSDGQIKLFGQNETTKTFKDIQNFIGVCFQDNVIFNLLSVLEHFTLFGAIRGISKKNLENYIDYFSENMQLTEMLNNRAGDLSGGQKRKLCISLSLLGNPPIVIMDEPTAGVDVQARQLIWKMIAGLKNTTTIITSHALEEAEAVSSRLFIVSAGNIAFCGTSTELRNQFKCGYLLKIDTNDGTVGNVIDFVKSFIPEAHISDERADTILIPVSPAVPVFLDAFENEMKNLGVNSYSFSVEQLEDMLLKLIQSEEVVRHG